MITGTVSSKELSTTSLRAQDYLFNPAQMAKDLIECWLATSVMGKVTSIRTEPLKHLVEVTTQALRIAYERGQKQKTVEILTKGKEVCIP